MSIESVMPSNQLVFCHPLILLPSIFPSIRVFSKESVLRFRWPKYWSSSFSISPSNEYSGLTCFGIDWFDLAVQGTLKSLLRQHNSKASVLWCSLYAYTLQIHKIVPSTKSSKTLAVLLLSTSLPPLPLKKLHWVLKDGVWAFVYDLGHRNVSKQMTDRLWGKNIYSYFRNVGKEVFRSIQRSLHEPKAGWYNKTEIEKVRNDDHLWRSCI